MLFLLCFLLAFTPALLLRLLSNQRLARKCSWLRNRPLVCAHGGDTSSAPPNTLEAYDQALLAEVDCVEIDASRSQDGVLVALHDRDLQNMYGNDYVRVGDLSFKEIVRLDAAQNLPNKSQYQMVPTLVNAVQHVSSYVKQIIIDAKVGGPMLVGPIAAGIVDAVNVTRCKNCLVWSKEDSLVKEFKRLSPHTLAGYIVMKDEVTGKMTSATRMYTPEVVGVYHGLITANFVKRIHKRGKRVFSWTVDDRETMRKMLHDEVDAIVTSQPHCEASFQALKNAVSTKPILRQPNWDVKFHVHVDVLGVAMGAILAQPNGKADYPVYFASRRFSKAEQGYSSIEREALGFLVKFWLETAATVQVLVSGSALVCYWLLVNSVTGLVSAGFGLRSGSGSITGLVSASSGLWSSSSGSTGSGL
ncbi:hypothetical protein L7F22_065564 [Adiantum nelumboides]|nr:hypothetical protein [Adiantum nelumboides]